MIVLPRGVQVRKLQASHPALHTRLLSVPLEQQFPSVAMEDLGVCTYETTTSNNAECLWPMCAQLRLTQCHYELAVQVSLCVSVFVLNSQLESRTCGRTDGDATEAHVREVKDRTRECSGVACETHAILRFADAGTRALHNCPFT